MASPVFVIVHGTYGGGWEWRDVANRLRTKGAEVFTPTLTGLGERKHLFTVDTDLDTHIADVTGVIETENLEGVILVGQSYGGVVVTGVADRMPERLAQLVYIDGLVPLGGESVADLVPPAAAPFIWDNVDEAANRLRLPFTPEVLAEAPEAERAYAARSSDHPLKSWTQPIVLNDAARSVPTTYIRCVSDDPISKLIEGSAARARERGWRYVEFQGPHDAHYFMPAELTEALASVTMSGR
ncbi:MAG TPA: alpha/beta fold hydrolase [Candidatus Dormibacteraeota bacterium]|nr:alpha/beta fold hydrolase [Candidatus Dormibacteraeota bacterium]